MASKKKKRKKKLDPFRILSPKELKKLNSPENVRKMRRQIARAIARGRRDYAEAMKASRYPRVLRPSGLRFP